MINDAVFVQHVLEFRDLLQEPLVFLLTAKTHDRLHHGPVVLASIEENDFALVGQLPDVPHNAIAPVRRPSASGRATTASHAG
ncbi:MAG: hypothetical protein R3B08_01520 [Nitrospira sp.]